MELEEISLQKNAGWIPEKNKNTEDSIQEAISKIQTKKDELQVIFKLTLRRQFDKISVKNPWKGFIKDIKKLQKPHFSQHPLWSTLGINFVQQSGAGYFVISKTKNCTKYRESWNHSEGSLFCHFKTPKFYKINRRLQNNPTRNNPLLTVQGKFLIKINLPKFIQRHFKKS